MIYLSIYLYISFSILLLYLVNEKNGKAVITIELKKWKEYVEVYMQILLFTPFIILSILIVVSILTIFLLVMPIFFILELIYISIKNIFNKLKRRVNDI